MPLGLSVAVVVVASHRRVLDGAVHPLDLPVRPWMQRLGQPVIDVEVGASRLEGVAAQEHALRSDRPDVLWRPTVAGGVSEVRAVVRQNRVDLIGDGLYRSTDCLCRGGAPV